MRKSVLPAVGFVAVCCSAVAGPGSGSPFVTMRDAIENYPVDTSLGGQGVSAAPESFTGPVGFDWGLNNLRGQTSVNFVRVVDLSGAPVGGTNGVVNATKAIRLRTGTAQPANGFFTGANIRWATPLRPVAGTNARVSAEHYLSTIDDLYTYEPVSVFQGLLIDRILWGGTCEEDVPGDCTEIGRPTGLLQHFTVYYTPLVTPPEPRALRYCADVNGNPFPGCVPPPGVMVGDPVAPPIANWFRLATETTADGVLRTYFDALDGFGEVQIQQRQLTATNTIDRLSWNASFEFQGAFMLIDNIEASGPAIAPLCATDFDLDGQTTFDDLSVVLTAYGSQGFPFVLGDADGDGLVDFTDLNSVLAAFGSTCD